MKVRLFARVDEIPAADWDAIAAHASCTFSRSFSAVVEQSRLNDFEYLYAIIDDDAGRPAALAILYSITTDLAIFAPSWLRNALAVIRKRFPNFFKLKMLECGTPVTLNSPPVAAASNAEPAGIVVALDALLRDLARRQKELLIVVRDFEPGSDIWMNGFRQRGYKIVSALPNTYLDITWGSSEQYISSMRSYFRSKLLKHLKICKKNNITHEMTERFADEAERLARQWNVVHSHADEFQREVLNGDFYRQLEARMDGRAKILRFRSGEEMVGHAILLQDGDLLRWLYFGREQAVNDSLYIYTGYAVIDAAIRLGARRLEMGLTTYQVKQDLGGEVVPLYLALRCTIPLVNPILGLLYRMLNAPPAVAGRRQVFKTAEAGR
jgi:predicted N-acyltransferase